MHAAVRPRLDFFPVEIVFTAHLALVLRTMTLDGRGIAWLPRTLIDDDLADGRLVAAASRDWDVLLVIRLYRDAEMVSKAGEAFWTEAISG